MALSHRAHADHPDLVVGPGGDGDRLHADPDMGHVLQRPDSDSEDLTIGNDNYMSELWNACALPWNVVISVVATPRRDAA
jgi:hypothetical protein